VKRLLPLALALAAAPAAGAQDPEETAKAVRWIRDQVSGSTVGIEVTRKSDPEGKGGSGPAGVHEDYYNRPLGPTTGTVLTADGYILTSWFNVSGDVTRITVVTPDGARHEGKRLGWDSKLDVALVKIEAKDLKPLPRAKLDDARPGDFVFVVGRAPDPAFTTVNLGILSAKGRFANTAVQTDAEINYGNAGGPLVNLQGELLGIVSHVRPREDWGQSGGVGFATKLDEIDKVLETLKKEPVPAAKAAKSLWIGILAAEPKAGVEGITIDQILPNSPAEEAGLDAGDVIVGLDSKPVKTVEDFKAELGKKAAGVERVLTIRRTKRDGAAAEEKKLKIKPQESPE
jgi:S1-C subfamily serine protease